MRGSDHYREAEKLLATAQQHITEDPRDMRIAEVSAYAAQVHATLAQAAAAALPVVTQFMSDSDEITQWGRATGAATTWTVVLSASNGQVYEYGPFRDEREADAFATWLTIEVDPARVSDRCTDPRALKSPVAELLAYAKQFGGGR